MAGWIKLWRKLKDNGHLKMPGTAFKLWIYCLLEAAPRPDRARELEVGELWLNYEHIRQVIGEAHRQMSKSTVSSALKYLEQSGYLKLQAKSFYGVKACVANWQDYQTGTISVPVESPSSTPASTETVPVEGASSTPTSTETVPVPVLAPVPVGGTEPNNGAASQSPKNIKNKDLKNTVVVDLAEHFAREFGRTLTPFEVSYLTKWRSEFPEELILAALARATLRDKRSLAYVGGILTNWQKIGIRTVDEIPQEKTVRSRRKSGQAGQQDAADRKKRDFIRSLYI
ncbi:DNA replication protein DnaD [Pelotomaculum schinkii]|uniref:DNA replication protein DnaD n=1 Tax=Pelotomaculum schinkii TaxID=78350 RepID=A0A4Y7RBY5_9FIRM|nr:DnaD domain protein [Pelotomaculum schinkii]TEB06494.1 DNA replication protein DnaD [Pelotomaculum schinkii]